MKANISCPFWCDAEQSELQLCEAWSYNAGKINPNPSADISGVSV